MNIQGGPTKMSHPYLWLLVDFEKKKNIWKGQF